MQAPPAPVPIILDAGGMDSDESQEDEPGFDVLARRRLRIRALAAWREADDPREALEARLHYYALCQVHAHMDQ